jgi:hypothetical protein
MLDELILRSPPWRCSAGRPGGRIATCMMREVWGHRAAIIGRTVDTHAAELRRKLEHDPANPRHILTVRTAGTGSRGERPRASMVGRTGGNWNTRAAAVFISIRFSGPPRSFPTLSPEHPCAS